MKLPPGPRYLLCLFLGLSTAAPGAEPDPLFRESGALAITLSGPLSEISSQRNKDREYPARLSYTDAAGSLISLDATIQARGNWRLLRENCRYPPLWVDLRRSQTAGTLFENQNRLKLVVQCGRGGRYADYLVRELQLYEMFSLLSPYHFDTRLLNVTYVEPDGSILREHPAFFIEHQNRIADRLEMSEVELNQVSNLELDPLQATLSTLFMYFVGNVDFSIIEGMDGEECCHNAKLLQGASGRYFPIPYDFDGSGFVNTNYAPPPHPSFRIRSNRQRYYRGFCVSDEVFNEATNRFNALQQDFVAIVGDQKGLSDRSTSRTLEYMDAFYDTLNDRQLLQRQILNRCQGRIPD